MRIEFRVEGGVAHFPGLSKPFTIDTTEWPEDEAIELERLVRASAFFELPSNIEAPRGAADYRRYTLMVEAGGRRHVVQVVDPVEDPNLSSLVAFLHAKAASRARGSDQQGQG